MSFWSLDNLKDVLGARWLREPANARAIATGLSTDTRAVAHGQVFLALKGETFDAHDFASQAAQAAASMLIVQREVDIPAGTECAVALVPDTRKALGHLAAAYRRTLSSTVIAVCGSNGKTTTVRLLDAALKGGSLAGTAAIKSFNNDIGVPLTILGAKPTDRYLICEVGSNAPGEIDALGAIVRPDIAVITSIGREHLEGFHDVEGVAREEASILRHLTPGGLAVVTADAPALRAHLSNGAASPRTITFGAASDATLRLAGAVLSFDDADNTVGLQGRTHDGLAFTLPMPGAHNALNALAAIAVARELRVPDASIVAGLGNARAADMRLNLSRVPWQAGDVLVINDAYNANPESMLAALATLRAIAKAAGRSRSVAILGDMRELGASADAAHGEVLAAACANADLVLAVGPSMSAATRTTPSVRAFGTLDQPALDAIAQAIRPSDAVLIKASRGMRLERIAHHLAHEGGQPPAVTTRRPAHGTHA